MLALLLFVLQVFVTLQTSDGEVVYVTPTPLSDPHSVCPPDQSCHTLQHYVDRFHDQQINGENLTISFLGGSHTVTCHSNSTCSRLFAFDITNLTIFAANNDVSVLLKNIYLYIIISSSKQSVHIENLMIYQGYIEICGQGEVYVSSVKIFNHKLLLRHSNTWRKAPARFKNLNASSSQIIIKMRKVVTFNKCYFINGTSPLIADHSHIIFVHSTFSNNRHSALVSSFSTITLSGVVSFVNNSGIMGGVMALLHSPNLKVVHGTNMNFVNNSAQEVGGAIFIEPDLMQSLVLQLKFTKSKPDCFFQILHRHNCNPVNFYFKGNNAAFGGNDVYGTSWDLPCSTQGVNDKRHNSCSIKTKGLSASNSSVSSEPTRVCLCNSNGQPECKYSIINRTVYLGEIFTVSAVVVGGDYGVTVGNVHANFLHINSSRPPNIVFTRYNQVIDDISCTELSYKLQSNNIRDSNNNLMVYLTSRRTHRHEVRRSLAQYATTCENTSCYSTPVFINISILPCPPGFTLLGEPSECGCYPVLTDNGIECTIFNGVSSFSWSTMLWLNISKEGIIYARYCPFDYCTTVHNMSELHPNSQCALN